MEKKNMPKKEYIAALDIGSSRITLAVYQLDDSQESERTLYLASVDSKGIANHVVSNKSDVMASLRSLFTRMEKELGYAIDHAHVAYLGGLIECRNERVSVGCKTVEDKSTNTIISEADLKTLEEESEKCLVGNSHLIFDKEPVQYLADGVRITSSVVNTYAQTCACDYNLFIAEQQASERLKRTLGDAKIAVDSISLGVRGCVEATTEPRQREQGVALLDIGTTRSQLVVYVGDRIQHYAWLPVGGKHFTDDIMQGRNIDRHEAEMEKVRGGRNMQAFADSFLSGESNGMDENGMPSLELIIIARLCDLVDLTLKQFDAWKIGRRLSVNGIRLTGGGACLDDIDVIFGKLLAARSHGVRIGVKLGISTLYKCTCVTDTNDKAALLRGATAIGLVHAAAEARLRAIELGHVQPKPQVVTADEHQAGDEPEQENESVVTSGLNRFSKFLRGLGLKDEPDFDDSTEK